MREGKFEKLAFSVAEFAEVLGISRGLAYQLVKSPEGPQVARVGSRILIPKKALENWLNEQAQTA